MNQSKNTDSPRGSEIPEGKRCFSGGGRRRRRRRRGVTHGFRLHPKVGAVPNDGFIEDLKKVDPREDGEDDAVDLAAYVAALCIRQEKKVQLGVWRGGEQGGETCSSVISMRSPWRISSPASGFPVKMRGGDDSFLGGRESEDGCRVSSMWCAVVGFSSCCSIVGGGGGGSGLVPLWGTFSDFGGASYTRMVQ